MKKLILILLMVGVVSGQDTINWISTGSTNTNLASNYSGPFTGVEVRRFDGSSSVINATATDVITCGGLVFNNYTGTFNMSGRELTIGMHGINGTGTSTAAHFAKVTFNASSSITIGPTFVFGGSSCDFFTNSDLTFNISRGTTFRSLTCSNSNVSFIGSATAVFSQTTSNPTLAATNSRLYGTSVAINKSISGDLLSLVNSSIETTTLLLGSSVATGDITLSIPKLILPFTNSIQIAPATSGECIFNCTDTLSTLTSVQILKNSAGKLTFNSDYPIITPTFKYGANVVGGKVYINFGAQKNTIGLLSGAWNIDSTYINFNNTIFDNPVDFALNSKLKTTGSYTRTTPTDLFMGHSMMAISGSGYWDPSFYYEKNYGKRVYKNRAVSGTVITTINSRVDSCLTAYAPNRFYLWIGHNELNPNSLDDIKFDSAVTAYWVSWRSIIAKVKAANVDSIYIVEMSPMGTVAAPMPDQKIVNFKRFNAALKDSCRANNLYWIPTFDSLLEPGYTNVLKLSTTTDGLHPNSTIAGAQYCGYLFSMAYIPLPVLTPSTDTLILRVSTTGADSKQWQVKRSGVWVDTTGETGDSLLVVADSSMYANKFTVRCKAINTVGTKISKEWQLSIKNNKRTINRK